MASKAEQLGRKLETVSENMKLLSSSQALGEIIIWLFSVEASLRECVRIYLEITMFGDYKKLPSGVLSKPIVNRPKRDIKKYPDKNRIYYGELDKAMFGGLLYYYKSLRPSNKKLYTKLDKIRKGRNKLVHELFCSKDVEATFSKLFPKYIREKPTKDVLEDIVNDIRDVLNEVKKVA